MKGEYVEQQQQHPKSETPPSMFSKLQPQHHPFPHHPFQLSAEDATTITPSTAQKANSSGGDGATIEVVRRPRGRPPGSKNKPKPPVIITRDPEPAMSPYILEVSGGNDVVEAIAQFSHRKNMGICVLTGSGTVANVTLRQPSTTPSFLFPPPSFRSSPALLRRFPTDSPSRSPDRRGRSSEDLLPAG